MERMIRDEISKTLNVDANSINGSGNLIEFGLHSLAIMQLVETFSKHTNERFKYTDFALSPTIDAWVQLTQKNR